MWALTNCRGIGVDPRASDNRITPGLLEVMPSTDTLYDSQSCGLQHEAPITAGEIGNQCWLTAEGFLNTGLYGGKHAQ